MNEVRSTKQAGNDEATGTCNLTVYESLSSTLVYVALLHNYIMSSLPIHNVRKSKAFFICNYSANGLHGFFSEMFHYIVIIV